jgi:hypothetical protein
MRTALKVTILVGLCLAVTGFFLQVIHVFPAGNSTAKTRFKGILFVIGAIFFLLTAAAEKDWRLRGGGSMPSWLGQTLFVAIGIILLATAVNALLGT